jgi:NADPH-dependent ferric siderophore reductase
MEMIHPARRVQRVRHELRRRDVRVARVDPVSPGFVSITFAGDSLADFVSDGFDDHVKFMFADDTGEMIRRDYTPRRFDQARRELTIEFAIHGHGQASAWARQATIGREAVIGGPRGSMIVPMDYHWHLLAGDATALPAIHRRLDELPHGTRAIVIGQLADAADQRRFDHSAAQVDLQWVSTPDDLVAAVRALRLPPGEGYVWGAGEAHAMAALREVLLVDKAHPREAMRVAAYWKRGASDYHDELGR